MRLMLAAMAFFLTLGSQTGRRTTPYSPVSAPRQDAWKILGPGGGGAQYLPTISPHDPKSVLVSCDMTGAYISQDAGDSWRMFNLRGTVRFAAFDPSEPETIYVYTIGLWRSTDAGNSWSLVFPRPADVSRIEMADDHASARLATRDGLYPAMSAFAIDPDDSRTLYAAVADAAGSSLQVSRDSGHTWIPVIEMPNGARRILIDPRSPADDRKLIVVGRDSVVVRERGVWAQRSALPGASSISDLSAGFAAAGGEPVLYVIAPPGAGEAGQLFVSADGGASWRRGGRIALAQAAAELRLVAVATSLNHPEVVYVSYSKLRTDSPGPEFFGVAKSCDYGQSWELVWNDATSAAPNLSDAWITERFGPGWGESPLSLGVAPGNPEICYGTDYGRTMRTTNGGESWEGVYSKRLPRWAYSTTGLDVTTCYGVHFDPFEKWRVFVLYTDIGLFRSDDGGTSWSSSSAGFPPEWVNTTYWVEFDPAVKHRMWAVMSGTHDLPRPKMWRKTSPQTYVGGVCISEDGGRTWTRSGSSLPPTAATHILLDPDSPPESRVLYVAGFGKGVFKSRDGGRTWILMNRGLEGNEPFAWRFARDRNGLLYLVIARRSEDGSFGNENDGAVYRSQDGAAHWERLPLPKGLNGPNGIAVDPEDVSRLYLAAWGRNAGRDALQGGVFISTDGGLSWRNVLSQDQHIYDVTIDPRDPRILYACGFESSAWRSTDRGESWNRIRGYNFKWGHRVAPDPINPKMLYITTFGGSVWYGPAAGDDHSVEDIITPQLAYSK